MPAPAPKQTKIGKASITQYKSLRHATDHIKQEYDRASELHPYMSTRDIEDKNFNGHTSLDEACRIISTTGYYKEGADLITQARINMPQSTQLTSTPSNEPYYVGHRPSVPRVLAGAPKSMIRRQPRQQRQAPAVRIAISTMADCNITSHQIANYGAAVLSCINELERQRVLVYADIVTAWATHHKNRSGQPAIIITIPVKTPQYNLSANEMSFLLTHPASIRRFQFALIETDPDAQMSRKLVSNGYGFPFTPTKRQLPHHDVITPALISGKIKKTYDTPESALIEMQKIFHKQQQASNKRGNK